MGKSLKLIGALAGISLGLGSNLPPAAAATITAADASYAAVSAAVASANNGDTVTVPAGTATWTQTLDLGTKAITLMGAGSSSTIITNGLIRSHNTGSNLVRISGFRFNNASGDGHNFPIINFAGPSYKVRVDHCYFDQGDTAIGTNFASWGSGPVWGVTDHCVFHNMTRPYYAMDQRFADPAIGGPDGTIPGDYSGAAAWTEPILPGSDHMMYIEDCTFNWDTIGNSPPNNAQGGLYGSYGGRCCFRYNILNGNDPAVDGHGDWPGHSTVFYEIYNNTFNYGLAIGIQGEAMWQRGGQWIVHDNTFNYPYTSLIHISIYYPNDSPAHWPKNSYFWGNTANGNSDQSAIVALKDSGHPPAHAMTLANVRLNQEYFLHAPQSGQTYYPYTPLVHPHPLVTGGGGSAPAPPGLLRVVAPGP